MARRRNGRRTFTPEYKAAVVDEYAVTSRGDRTALLKRLGLARGQVAQWRQQYPIANGIAGYRAIANGNRPGGDLQLEQVMRQVSREITFAAEVRALVAKYAGEEKS